MALQDLIMMLPSRLGCPLSLKTPNMGNPSSMRFHPTGGEPEDDKDGQAAWFTARIASLIG